MATASSEASKRGSNRMTRMWNHPERLLSERSGPAGWLGVPTGTPQAYRARKGNILMSLDNAAPKGWDDDDVAEDDEEEDEDDELVPDDDADDLEDDEGDDDVDDED